MRSPCSCAKTQSHVRRTGWGHPASTHASMRPPMHFATALRMCTSVCEARTLEAEFKHQISPRTHDEKSWKQLCHSLSTSARDSVRTRDAWFKITPQISIARTVIDVDVTLRTTPCLEVVVRMGEWRVISRASGQDSQPHNWWLKDRCKKKQTCPICRRHLEPVCAVGLRPSQLSATPKNLFTQSVKINGPSLRSLSVGPKAILLSGGEGAFTS